MIDRPISVSANWAASDELSDAVKLDEAFAVRQWDESPRLRSPGVSFDHDLLEACLSNGIKPGLWLSGNSLARRGVASPWLEIDLDNASGDSLPEL